MKPVDEPIRITRGQGGQVEADGPVDAFAADVLHRAGFLFPPVLDGRWIRLPFDLGRVWENEQATWAAEMLAAAHYPVHLSPDLQTNAPELPPPSGPARPPVMTARAPTASRRTPR